MAKTPRIIIFYHCLVYRAGEPPQLLSEAVGIIQEFARYLRDSGLSDAASEIIVGVNGGEESVPLIRATMPDNAKLIMHGLNSFAENLTLVEIEKWVKQNRERALILYAHSKGATHVPLSSYAQFAGRWRRCMLQHCLCRWEQCVHDLEHGYEAVGCHWMTGQGWDRSQSYFAGNFFWATSDFLARVPSIYLRDRIKTSGIASPESRYEAEVWLGNANPLPRVRDYVSHTVLQCP